MTTTPSQALDSLGISGYRFAMDGEPADEAEFLASFRRHTGETEVGVAIESADPADFGVTWTEIAAEQARLDQLTASMAHRPLRKAAYVARLSSEGQPLESIGDPLDALYTATEALADTVRALVPPAQQPALDAALTEFRKIKSQIDAIKQEFPKPNP